ncbi:MAG TPA: hypothetical protein ENI60_01265 [Candidatus Fraserbacteria bacterium]|nr:hypothetical protein [Candidatus Fraserbacteria bacterium]
MKHVDMFTIELKAAQEHYQELLRQAEAERLAQRVARSISGRGHPLRVKVGGWLIAAGQRLAGQVASPALTTERQRRSVAR